MVVVIVEEPSSAKTSGDQRPGRDVWYVNAFAPQLQQAEEINPSIRQRWSTDRDMVWISQKTEGILHCAPAFLRGLNLG